MWFTASLTFKSISTRGFNSSGNVRMNQLVDGMDNQAPGLNFSVGNVVGLTDLDVDKYGVTGRRLIGIIWARRYEWNIFNKQQKPFQIPGVSVQVREGVMNVDDRYRDRSPYHDFSFRWGQKVSDKFAF
jgi:hypothetical protein